MITTLTKIIDVFFKLKYVQIHWKVSEVIMILKHGKVPHQVTSLRHMPLLLMQSKVFKKLLLVWLVWFPKQSLHLRSDSPYHIHN